MIQITLQSEAVQQRLDSQLADLLGNRIASRIGAKDASIWGPAAESEASIRLNWLDAPQHGTALVEAVQPVADAFRAQGVTRVVLSGMGGSSLAPEVIARSQQLSLVTLDATDPGQVRHSVQQLAQTVLVNSSKSGSTVETDSHRRVFEQAFTEAGIDPHERIVFVTDPGSPLAQSTTAAGFAHVIEADPLVGGRFSALTAFGIVPTLLAGGSVDVLLHDAAQAREAMLLDSPDNPVLMLAAAIAEKSPQQNKLILVEDPDHEIGLGDWIEQLIAESTGKEATGILPVIVAAGAPELSSAASDQIVLWLGSADAAQRHGVNADIVVDATLGEHFMLWEYATSVMGYLLQINPFDQPDVESAKLAARALLDSGIQEAEVSPLRPGLGIRGSENLGNPADIATALRALLAGVKEDSYFAVQVYLDRVSHPEYFELREVFAAATARPTTFGWGPRFLHSTGQFHKGGQAQGVFLQLVASGQQDYAIPGRDFTFAQLMGAQADGDREVLAGHGRPVLSLAVLDPKQALSELREILKDIHS